MAGGIVQGTIEAWLDCWDWSIPAKHEERNYTNQSWTFTSLWIFSHLPFNRYKVFLLQVLCYLHNCFFDRHLITSDVDLCMLWLFVWSGDTGEIRNLSCAGLFVQSFRVSLLGNLNWDIDEDLNEWDWLITTLGGILVEVARDLTIGFVWWDEGGQGRGGSVGKEFCDLYRQLVAGSWWSKGADFSDSSNVLVTILFCEAQVLVQSEAHIVSIQSICRDTQVEKMLLESSCNCGLSGSR